MDRENIGWAEIAKAGGEVQAGAARSRSGGNPCGLASRIAVYPGKSVKGHVMDEAAGGPILPRRQLISLASAVRHARIEGAEHSGVIAELRAAEYARLDMLFEALAPILAEVPPGVDLFDASLMPGEYPRLFIDMIGFVEMARDRRVYRFVQDTRHGRIIMAETDQIDIMADAVRTYIARRLIERERALASDRTVEAAAQALIGHAAGGRWPPLRSLHFTALQFVITFLGAFALGMMVLAAGLATFYAGFPSVRAWVSGHFG